MIRDGSVILAIRCMTDHMIHDGSVILALNFVDVV